MHCDNNIHYHLIEEGYIECPFCNLVYGKRMVKEETYCNNQEMIKDYN